MALKRRLDGGNCRFAIGTAAVKITRRNGRTFVSIDAPRDVSITFQDLPKSPPAPKIGRCPSQG